MAPIGFGLNRDDRSACRRFRYTAGRPESAAIGKFLMHCSHPGHHHASSDLLGRLEIACAERGLRLTELRRRVFELVADSARPVKAYDLLEKVRKQGAGPAAPPTVYRALDFLMANGFVHRLETLNAYVPCPHPEAEAHGSQFLICEQCQETMELDASGISDRLRDQARQQGFQPRRHIVEVYGLCAKCQGAC
jgi:Fur family zinc uptake transcriptional regulator